MYLVEQDNKEKKQKYRRLLFNSTLAINTRLYIGCKSEIIKSHQSSKTFSTDK
jgi:hypothetical protein